MKLTKLIRLINDGYLMTHILASLPQEYSSVVDHAKIDWRSKTLTLAELKKRLKEKYMQLQKEKGWGEDEIALSASHSIKFQKKGTNPRQTPRFLREDAATVVSVGIRKRIVESGCSKQMNKKNNRNIYIMSDAVIVVRWGTLQRIVHKRNQRIPVGDPVRASQ